MNDRHNPGHTNAEAMQAFLEGDLPEKERARIEEHLHSCARCSAELGGWRALFEGLEDLPALAPGVGFADRVIGGVQVAEPLSWAARVRQRVGALAGGGHPDGERLQDFAEGLLPERQAARVRAHLGDCGRCADATESWRHVLGALDGLGRFEPAEGFAARVMADVRVPVPAAAVERVPEWRRALAWARRLVPHSRKAWAAVSGVALTPAVTLGLLIWTVFTHPTVTPGALASFAWWKISDLAAAGWNVVVARAMQSAELFNVFSFVQSLALSPAVLVVAFVAFSLGTVAAAWVLYRNLIDTHPTDGRYAHASLS